MAVCLPCLHGVLALFEVVADGGTTGRLGSDLLEGGITAALGGVGPEAAEQHIPSVPLTPVSERVTYTVAILRGAADPAAATAFVAFLLGPSGRATLAHHGLTVLHPRLVGSAGAVPEGLRSLLGAG